MALISDHVATVHIVGTVLIALFGALGCSAPLTATLLARRQPKIMRYLSFVQLALTALGAGVVISTALLHILPEGSEMLVNGGLGGEAEAAAEPSENNATSAFYLSSSTSSLVKAKTSDTNHKKVSSNKKNNKIEASHYQAEEEPEKDEETEDEPYPYGPMLMLVGLVATYIVDSEIHRFASAHQEATMKAHITEVGIATHSVLIGVAFGSMSKVDSVNTLAIALMLHQLCEGFAMGPVIYKGARTVLHAVVLIGIFAVATPIGIGIGALALQYGDPGSKQANLSQGILSCLAAGMLMYVGAVEFLGGLQHSMEHSEAAHLEKVPKDDIPSSNINKDRETVRIQDGTHRHSHRMFFPNAEDNEDEEKRTLLSSKRSLRASSSAPATPFTPAGGDDGGEGAFGNPNTTTTSNNAIDEDEVVLPATFLQDYPTLGRMTSHVMVLIGGSAMAVLAMYS